MLHRPLHRETLEGCYHLRKSSSLKADKKTKPCTLLLFISGLNLHQFTLLTSRSSFFFRELRDSSSLSILSTWTVSRSMLLCNKITSALLQCISTDLCSQSVSQVSSSSLSVQGRSIALHWHQLIARLQRSARGPLVLHLVDPSLPGPAQIMLPLVTGWSVSPAGL